MTNVLGGRCEQLPRPFLMSWPLSVSAVKASKLGFQSISLHHAFRPAPLQHYYAGRHPGMYVAAW